MRLARAVGGMQRRLTSAELGAVGIALVVFGALGWDQPLWDAPSQATLHLIGALAFLALAAYVVRGGPLPRTPVDVPILALLVAIGLAAALGKNPGLAAGAFAASLAYAALLPVALLAYKTRPVLTSLVVVVPTLGLALFAMSQLVLARLAWYAAGGPGLIPPVRVGGETTLFGSVAVPPFILLGLLPLTLTLRNPPVRRTLVALTLGLWVVAAALSGSRSAWIAAAAAILVLAAPNVRNLFERRIRRPTRRQWVLALGAGVVGLLLLAYEAPRLTALTSLIYRGRLWSDTLDAWRASPLIGIGPGTMPYARQAAAAQFPLHQAHSHDVALGLLGDAGVVGLVAGALVVAIFFWVAGPHRSRTPAGRAAAAVLVGYLVASFFDDLTFLPNYSLLVVLLAALALTDAHAVSWRPLRRRTPLLVMGGMAAVALTGVVLIRDGAALAYRVGADASASGSWEGAARWLEVSESLDPWQPSTPKSLAIAADAAGDEAGARAAAQRATSLNAGDGPSWTNLAILCLRANDQGCAGNAANEAAVAASPGGPQLIDTAMVLNEIGDFAAADELYVLAVRNNRNVALAIHWPRPIKASAIPDTSAGTSAVQLNVVLARAAGQLPLDPNGFSSPAVRAYAAAIEGDERAAREAIASAQRADADDVLTWEISAVLEKHWGADPSHAVAVANVLRGGPTSVPSLPRQTWDVASFRSYPLDQLLLGANHLLPSEAWPWSLEQFLRPREGAGAG